MHLVLYQPEIPQNTGNIGRTCVALGAKLWLVRPLGFRVDDRHLKRAAMDYWDHLQWEAVADWAAVREALRDAGAWWFFTKGGARAYDEVEYGPDDVLVFGNESSGLPSGLLAEHHASTLRIPMRPPVRCLNLATSAGIAAYQARQREPR